MESFSRPRLPARKKKTMKGINKRTGNVLKRKRKSKTPSQVFKKKIDYDTKNIIGALMVLGEPNFYIKKYAKTNKERREYAKELEKYEMDVNMRAPTNKKLYMRMVKDVVSTLSSEIINKKLDRHTGTPIYLNEYLYQWKMIPDGFLDVNSPTGPKWGVDIAKEVKETGKYILAPDGRMVTIFNVVSTAQRTFLDVYEAEVEGY